MSKFDKRFSRISDLKAQIITSRLTQIKYGASYLNEATECFHQHLPISCIVVSSALVERTLFWRKMKLKPLKAGETIRYGAKLGKLFKEFVDRNILFNSLLDADEQLNLKLMRERKSKECNIEKAKKLDKYIEKFPSKVRYVETRNLFAHGKELLIPMPLTHLLPADSYASSEYGINSKEWWNPTLTTIAYVHLSKTLCFMKALTDLLIQK